MWRPDFRVYSITCHCNPWLATPAPYLLSCPSLAKEALWSITLSRWLSDGRSISCYKLPLPAPLTYLRGDQIAVFDCARPNEALGCYHDALLGYFDDRILNWLLCYGWHGLCSGLEVHLSVFDTIFPGVSYYCFIMMQKAENLVRACYVAVQPWGLCLSVLICCSRTDRKTLDSRVRSW